VSWERAFVVATLMIGDSFDDALASLHDAPRSRIAPVVSAVRGKPRPERAKWMATVLAEAALEIDRMSVA
jgi:hypothetical protein